MLETAFESDFEGLVESDFEFDTEDYGEDFGEFDEAVPPPPLEGGPCRLVLSVAAARPIGERALLEWETAHSEVLNERPENALPVRPRGNLRIRFVYAFRFNWRQWWRGRVAPAAFP